MAEAIGIISSAITIWDVVYKVKKCHSRMKAAPARWKDYGDKLESLAYVQEVLEDIIASQTHGFDDAKSQELVTMAINELKIIKKQASNILGAFEEFLSSKRRRVWVWLRVKRETLKFVVTEEQLEGLIASAEKAKMSLQSAICLQQLEIFNSGQTQMQNTIQMIYDSMKENAEALERINTDNKLSRMAFQFVDDRDQPVKRPKRRKSDTHAPNSKSKHSSRRSNKTRTSTKHQRLPTKGPPGPRTEEQNGHAAGGYELVLRNNEVLIMATDAAEHKPTADGNCTGAQARELIRLEEELEGISDDKWEQGMGSHLYELQPSATSTSASTSRSLNELDLDLHDDTIPIRVNVEKGIHAFVNKGTDLSECIYGEIKSMLFCVSNISTMEIGQTFTIQERCQHRCDHLELQIMDTWSSTKKLPYIMTFQSMTCGLFSGEANEVPSAQDFSLQSFHRCPDRTLCSHTFVEGDLPEYDGRTSQTGVCLCSETLQAWLDDYGWESDTRIETTTEDFPHGLTTDDEGQAVLLLRAIMHGYLPVPAQVSFGVLVGFLKLVERFHLEEVYMARCYSWTNAIISEVSSSFDRDAIAWAWVLWKVQMGHEFKTLSGIIQRQAKHCIGQEANQYRVPIPKHLASKYMAVFSTYI
ncbi:hypothetical protein FGADI_789 [Fusarium gaditjirri]|uniref:Fungal N-terminal domain-containing protein n=1 Tax=Fusarium gaditjirri TaxID=282569 RepID=A0A8H4X445_9HYPO|nr:hypothetical protein FGADI_789 [Fusarium gaditjirri]